MQDLCRMQNIIYYSKKSYQVLLFKHDFLCEFIYCVEAVKKAPELSYKYLEPN